MADRRDTPKVLELVAADIKKGRTYEAKKLAYVGLEQAVNDRMVVYVSHDQSAVQYDSPTVGFGKRYPIVSMEAFLKWAYRDVTELMPKGDWRTDAQR